ncbi:hypothetical protein DOY81_008799, partial [Sarcophaga bullata]
SILPHLNMPSRVKEIPTFAELNFYENNAGNATTTVASSEEEEKDDDQDRRLEITNSNYNNSFNINPEEMANADIANTDNNNLYFIQPQQQLLMEALGSSSSNIFDGQHADGIVNQYEDYTEYFNLSNNDTSSPDSVLLTGSTSSSSSSSSPALHLLVSLASVTTTTISSITYKTQQQSEETFQQYIKTRYLDNSTYPPFTCEGESQSLSDSNDTGLSSVYFKTAVYLLYIPIFVFALLGNGTVCYIVQSTPRMRTVTNYFIANLAVGDILMSLFCVPSSFISIFILGYWPFGIALCHFVNYSQAVSVLVSAYTLVAISIDRYIAIMWPLRPRITKRYAKFIIAGIWIIALATAFPIPIVSKLVQPGPWHEYCER